MPAHPCCLACLCVCVCVRMHALSPAHQAFPESSLLPLAGLHAKPKPCISQTELLSASLGFPHRYLSHPLPVPGDRREEASDPCIQRERLRQEVTYSNESAASSQGHGLGGHRNVPGVAHTQ